MKTFIAITLLCVTTTALADKYVNGYVKRDGTYVEGHFKTEPNGYKFDNYSTRGNTNPYTGQQGTIDPYKIDGSNVPLIPQSPVIQYGNQYGR